MAQSNQPPKTMSSRLMTMKFMQRAAGAGGASTPQSSSPATPSQPSSKRQRLSNGSYQSSATSTPDSEARAIRDALAAEEQKRLDALEREAADRGETKWYLSFHEPSRPAVQSPLRVVSAGFSTLDSAEDIKRRADNDDDEDEGPRLKATAQGRRSFGRFNRAVEKNADPDVSSEDSDESQSDSEDEEDDPDAYDPDGADAMINQVRKETAEKARAERKKKRKAEKAEMERLAAERRKKNVNLNDIQTISGSHRPPDGSVKDMVCFNCNCKGHKASNCPQAKRRSLD